MDKDKKNIVMIAIIVIAFGAMAYILFFNGEDNEIADSGILSILNPTSAVSSERFENLESLKIDFLESEKFKDLKEIKLIDITRKKGNSKPFGEKEENEESE